jgi:hypothetical protein
MNHLDWGLFWQNAGTLQFPVLGLFAGFHTLKSRSSVTKRSGLTFDVLAKSPQAVTPAKGGSPEVLGIPGYRLPPV